MRLLHVYLAITVVFLAAPVFCQVLDDFDSGADAWEPEMMYGKVDGCRASLGSGALRVDFDFGSEGTNHIIYAKPISADLSMAERLSFDVKGAGPRVKVFLFLWDDSGRHTTYGPHGSNTDFHSEHRNWHTCRVTFDTDKPVEGGAANLSSIRKIGFMLNQDGVCKGTVWFDNLAAEASHGKIRLSSSQISPNGDGFRDSVKITAIAPPDTDLDLRVYDSKGKLVSTLAEGFLMGYRQAELSWDGIGAVRRVPPGTYNLKATFKGKQTTTYKASVTVEDVPGTKPIKYQAKPFFPIGVWFEGNPLWGGYPNSVAGAKAYYDRCFADMAAHGINTVAVPNCPESLWEMLLQSAERHRIKVVLEVGPLVSLITSGTATEAQVHKAVKSIHGKIGKYQSLLRYQVRDEPAPTMVPNWLLVQRVLATVDPTRPAFSCFCSVDALTSVTSQTQLSEAVFDIYPLGTGAPAQTLGGFVPALDAFRKASADNTPWAVLQSFAKPGAWRYPSPEELRAMTYLSLAAGCKGVFYFIYQTLPSHPEKLEGLVDPGGKPKPIYEEVTRLAREMGKLSPLLLQLRSTSASPLVQTDARLAGFVDKTGRRVLILASARPDVAINAKLTGVADGSWRDAISDETFTSADGSMEVPLGPGCGRVLIHQ